MDNSDLALKDYITSQRSLGLSDDAIKKSLLVAGWPENLFQHYFSVSNEATVPLSNPGVMYARQGGFFSGRISRLGLLIAYIYVILIPVSIILVAVLVKFGIGNSRVLNIILLLAGLGMVVVALPLSISLHMRRWHDLDQSGWLVLLGFLPLVGPVIGILLLVLPGTSGSNKYGDIPEASFSFKHVFNIGSK